MTMRRQSSPTDVVGDRSMLLLVVAARIGEPVTRVIEGLTRDDAINANDLLWVSLTDRRLRTATNSRLLP